MDNYDRLRGKLLGCHFAAISRYWILALWQNPKVGPSSLKSFQLWNTYLRGADYKRSKYELVLTLVWQKDEIRFPVLMDWVLHFFLSVFLPQCRCCWAFCWCGRNSADPEKCECQLAAHAKHTYSYILKWTWSSWIWLQVRSVHAYLFLYLRFFSLPRKGELQGLFVASVVPGPNHQPTHPN